MPKALKKKIYPELAGTTWVGNESDFGAMRYTFFEDGRFEYEHGNGKWINGTWNQVDDTVYWEHNKKYSEFRGKFIEGALVGEKTNVNGLRWSVNMTQKKE